MSRWWWVRHGPTGGRTFAGWTDIPARLDDAGALVRLKAALPDAPIVSSDLGRARATADAIADGRPRWCDERDLREINFGAWEDRTFDDIAATTDDALLRAVFETPGHGRPPGGESWNDLALRVSAVVDALDGRAPDIIAVAHAGPITTQIARAEGLAPRAAMRRLIGHLTITRIDRNPAPRLIYAGRHS